MAKTFKKLIYYKQTTQKKLLFLAGMKTGGDVNKYISRLLDDHVKDVVIPTIKDDDGGGGEWFKGISEDVVTDKNESSSNAETPESKEILPKKNASSALENELDTSGRFTRVKQDIYTNGKCFKVSKFSEGNMVNEVFAKLEEAEKYLSKLN